MSLARRAQQSVLPKNTEGLKLDSQLLKASFADKSVDLTSMEADALQILIKHRGEVVSRDDLLNLLKGIDSEVFSRSIDILISRLRVKLKQLSDKPFIFTARGKGYRFWDE